MFSIGFDEAGMIVAEGRLVQADRRERVGEAYDQIVPAAECGEQPARLLVGRVGRAGDRRARDRDRGHGREARTLYRARRGAGRRGSRVRRAP